MISAGFSSIRFPVGLLGLHRKMTSELPARVALSLKPCFSSRGINFILVFKFPAALSYSEKEGTGIVTDYGLKALIIR